MAGGLQVKGRAQSHYWVKKLKLKEGLEDKKEREGTRERRKKETSVYIMVSSGGRLLTCPISPEEGGRPCYK